MNSCDATQRRLAEEGAEFLQQDAEAARHVEGCADCTRFLADLERVETALGAMPDVDAPDSLVADTLSAVRAAGPAVQTPARPSPRRLRLAGALAASVVIAATIGLTHNLIQSPDYQTEYGDSVVDYSTAVTEATDGKHDQSAGGASGRLDAFDEGAETAKQAHRSITEDTQPAEVFAEAELRDLTGSLGHEEDGRLAAEKGFANAPADESEGERQRTESDLVVALNSLAGAPDDNVADERWREQAEILALSNEQKAKVEHATRVTELERSEETKNQRGDADSEALAAAPQGAKSKAEESVRGVTALEPAPSDYFALESNELAVVGGASTSTAVPVVTEAPENAAKRAADEDDPASTFGFNDLESGRSASSADEDTGQTKLLSKDRAVRESQVERDAIGDLDVSTTTHEYGGCYRQNRAYDPETARSRAKAFLDGYDRIEGLAFQSATDYWANTYIPGDSAMRLLASRLRGWDRLSLGPEWRLEQAARQVAQPFDAPTEAALAVYLHADTSGIQGPTRMRVQVGLKGAERHGGHRPAMNIGLVVDARESGGDRVGARVRALITALVRIRQPGDRFSLTVAGPGGGMLVSPEQFRHGPLRVAMERLFGDRTAAGAEGVDLIDAVALASESVRRGDDPNAVLGASLVLLATGSSIAGNLDALERLAHAGAVGGVPLSVVRLSDRADLDDIDRLVAAGQGNRRILDTADQADALIDRELHAASRAVARAVRLRIRLAPGVKLVEVLGSHRLEMLQAERVREAEQALDQRLARNLGIEADRGDDEEGIQIVIPSFYAGDAHVILLDVVAGGPGPIADVTARYKDVVYLRNGVASAHLTIGAGPTARGPLERNVLKNLAAWELSRATRRASNTMRAGDVREVGALVATLRELIYGLRLEVASWSTDAELVADEAMLDDYLAVLEIWRRR